MAQSKMSMSLEVYKIHYAAEIRDTRTGETEIVEGSFASKSTSWPERQVMQVTGSDKRKPPLIFVRLESFASEKFIVTFDLQDLIDADFSAVEYC